MKKTHRGFTLVELLIVVAIIGVLGAMMTMSSTDAVDSAGANNILNNLQSMRTAAMAMYMEKPKVASLSEIKLAGSTTVDSTTAEAILATYLGKKNDEIGITGNVKYGLIGNKNTWYVVYKMDTKDTKGVRAKLKDVADKTDLYGQANLPAATREEPDPTEDDEDNTKTVQQSDFGFSEYYAGTENAGTTHYIALKVR